MPLGRLYGVVNGQKHMHMEKPMQFYCYHDTNLRVYKVGCIKKPSVENTDVARTELHKCGFVQSSPYVNTSQINNSVIGNNLSHIR